MKKLLTLFLMFITCINCTACSHDNTSDSTQPSCVHIYSSATCTSPQKCTKCGTIKGSSLGHNYKTETCISPKVCARCGETMGSSLGHSYSPATCTAPKTCIRCGKISGTELGHTYIRYDRYNDYWKYSCGDCGSTCVDTIKINFFAEIVDIITTYGEYNNKRYSLIMGSDVSNGYTYTRSVVYDSLTQELCFNLTFGNDINLDIYMTSVSREYYYYFEDKGSHYYMEGFLETDGCTLYYSYLYSENLIKTNVPTYLESDFAKLLQSQVILFIKCFNVDFAFLQITAQDFCFPNV